MYVFSCFLADALIRDTLWIALQREYVSHLF